MCMLSEFKVFIAKSLKCRREEKNTTKMSNCYLCKDRYDVNKTFKHCENAEVFLILKSIKYFKIKLKKHF